MRETDRLATPVGIAKILATIVMISIMFFTIAEEFYAISENARTINMLQTKIANVEYADSHNTDILQNKIEYIDSNYTSLSYFHGDMAIIKDDFRHMEANITLNTKEINLIAGRTDIMENQINNLPVCIARGIK